MLSTQNETFGFVKVNGGWIQLNLRATTSVLGLVKQSARIENPTAMLPSQIEESIADDIAALKSDHNLLVEKYNKLLLVTAELQEKLITHFNNERSSGQQSTI